MNSDVLPQEDGALAMNERKQQFSFGYVRMVVAAAGCSVKCHTTDYGGVDITIASSADYAVYYCPEFELQLKCTSQQDLYRDDGTVAWAMKKDPYDKLTNRKRFCPAYLGVLVLPPEPKPWLEQDEEGLITRSRLYWAKASDLKPSSEAGGSRTVYLPRSNLFDVPQLLDIMRSIGEGGGR